MSFRAPGGERRDAGPATALESLKIVVTDPIISRFEDAAEGRRRRPPLGHGCGVDSGTPAWTPWRAPTSWFAPPSAPRKRRPRPRVRLVHVTGAGYDKISFPHLAPSASVANTFHHARPIAEHVLMVTLMLSRNVAAADREVRQGQWRTIATADDVPFHPVLADLTLGLVGLGSIGAEVARVAGLLGMKVRAVRRNPSAPLPEGVQPGLGGRKRRAPRAAGRVRRRGGDGTAGCRHRGDDRARRNWPP